MSSQEADSKQDLSYIKVPTQQPNQLHPMVSQKFLSKWRDQFAQPYHISSYCQTRKTIKTIKHRSSRAWRRTVFWLQVVEPVPTSNNTWQYPHQCVVRAERIYTVRLESHWTLANLFPRCTCLLLMHFAMPCTICDADTTFSELRCIKNYLRSRTTQCGLNSCC